MSPLVSAFAAFNVAAVCLDAVSTQRYVPISIEGNPLARWLFVRLGKPQALVIIVATTILYSTAMTYASAPWSYLCCAVLGVQGWLHSVAAYVNTYRKVPPTGGVAMLIMIRMFNLMSKVRFGRN